MSQDIAERYLTLHELVADAHAKLPNNTWAYITGGAETETALRRNRVAIDSYTLRPRVLNDVSSIDSTCEIFGNNSRLPVLLCPVGGLESIHADGALAVANAAQSFGIPMMLSSVSDWSPDKLLQASGQGLSLIFQLYARENATRIDECVELCNQIELPAFCITVDSAIYSRRERDIAGRYVKPWRAKGEGQSAKYQASLSWKDIQRIRKNFDRQLALKGIATKEDALLAIEHGVDVIYVSNHGGRQLDHVDGAIDTLPEIVDAVSGRAQVWVDGGFCRGTDIAKAIALGANGVGLGRMMCYALAAAGSDGVIRMLELLELEYRTALGLLGVRTADALNPDFVRKVEPLSNNSNNDSALLSAFPLLRDIGTEIG